MTFMLERHFVRKVLPSQAHRELARTDELHGIHAWGDRTRTPDM